MAAQDRFSLRNLYLYLVCLITLIIVIFAAANMVRGGVELAYPGTGFAPYELAPDREADLSEEQIAERERQATEYARRQGVLGLVYSGAMLLIAGPLYVYHWRKIQEERPSGAALGAGDVST